MRLSPFASTAYFVLLLLPFVSSEALPALDPCWRKCVTHLLSCGDNDWKCFCRQARTTTLLADSVTCIRQNCTAGRPFDPVTLLTPFQENCKNPISGTIYANAEALAGQDSSSSQGAVPSTALSSAIANSHIEVAVTSASSSAPANAITTTFVGIATDADGQQVTLTVPALIGATSTIWGKPVADGQNAIPPSSTITLPWPTLPVGYFSSTHTSGNPTNGVLSRQSVDSRTRNPAATATGADATQTSTASGQRGQQAGNSSNDDGGTVLEVSEGTNHGAGSSLGLMVVLAVGVLWF